MRSNSLLAIYGKRKTARILVKRARALALVRSYQTLELLRGGVRPRRAAEVPVVINNFNRLGYLEEQLAWLEAAGFRHILILDNASTYPPLLELYRRTRHEVLPLGRNLGPYALWKHPVFRRVRGSYYVYTDPDVVPVETCPTDFLDVFFDALATHRWCEKVGFGLAIDDLPACYERADQVREWEAQHWTKPCGENLYEATIDTTFALYRPYAAGGFWCRAIRTGGPYVARHLPWYEDSAHPTEEDRHYRAHARKGASHWMSAPGEYLPSALGPRGKAAAG